jgi:hypothetical protein
MILWLRMLSLLLPAKTRYAWRREWHAELYAVRQEVGRLACWNFLRGARADVFAQRELIGLRLTWSDVMSLRGMSALLLVLIVTTLGVPASRDVLLAPAYAGDGVVLLRAGHAKVSGEQLLDWSYRMDQLRVRRMAFYSVNVGRVNGVPVKVAMATPELMQVLGLDLRAFSEGQVVLSRAWVKRFGRDASVEIGGVRHVVEGEVPETTLRLPEEPEVFLFAQDVRLDSQGYVIGEKMQAEVEMRGVALVCDGREVVVSYEPMAMRTVMPWRAFWIAVVMTVLALPASRALSNRDTVSEHGALSTKVRTRAAGFVLLQMMLVVAASGLVALLVASLVHCAEPMDQSQLQAVFMFALLLPLLRVVLHVHRHRCPCCLRPLGHAVKVGSPSASFLDWYGVEMVCSQGHGLVYVPDMPTTWFPAPRWVAMDASWSGLFE